MGKNSIISWNCRGIKTNFNKVKLLVKQESPVAICLQETFLKEDDRLPIIKNYNGYHNFSACANDKATGGTSIYVRNDVPQSEIKLDTQLDAKAVIINQQKTVTLCCLYIPPSHRLEKTEIHDLYHKFITPALLVGDYNAHNTLWGSRNSNAKGKTIEEFITENDLSLLNDKSPTYISPATGSMSIIDLAICHPSLFLDYNFHVDDDLHGSDHYPLLLQPASAPVVENPARWKLQKATWSL